MNNLRGSSLREIKLESLSVFVAPDVSNEDAINALKRQKMRCKVSGVILKGRQEMAPCIYRSNGEIEAVATLLWGQTRKSHLASFLGQSRVPVPATMRVALEAELASFD